MRLLLITPPLTQINTAYPATEQLTGYLRGKGLQCDQMDLSIELINKILTRECVSQIFDIAEGVHVSGKKAINIRIILSNKDFYTKWVEPVKKFLQGHDSTFARLFANPQFWANQKRLPNPEDMEWDYGTSGTFNQAQYLCTLFIEDIGNVIQQCISPHFEMVRYAEKLCHSLSDFTPLDEELAKEPNLIDKWMLELLEQKISETKPTHLGLSIPFPGNLYGGLRCAQYIKQKYPDIHEPIHWGRTGDPICISVYDHYAISKTMAERTIVESGIRNWVCLRQSGILYPEILKNYDPIMFHVPLRGVLEWATVEDSGRLLANLCEDNVPGEFWNRFYNIGSGKEYRLSNYEFECKLLKAIHCPSPQKIFRPEWFVLRNFHGQWYLDSDVLENYLHFRANVPVDEYFTNMGKLLPWFFNLAAIVPGFIIRWAMRPMAYKKKWGTQWWIKHNEKQRISAYYGSLERYKAIPDWKHQDLSHPSETDIVRIDHGYDEQKPRSEWTIDDMRKAAEFRGGKCLSETMENLPAHRRSRRGY